MSSVWVTWKWGFLPFYSPTVQKSRFDFLYFLYRLKYQIIIKWVCHWCYTVLMSLIKHHLTFIECGLYFVYEFLTLWCSLFLCVSLYWQDCMWYTKLYCTRGFAEKRTQLWGRYMGYRLYNVSSFMIIFFFWLYDKIWLNRF